MLRSLKELFGYTIQAKDREIGQVFDFYFDDEEWAIRYLVVETGAWIFGRKVLIIPHALGQPNWTAKDFPVNLTSDEIKASPDIKTALPISRQQQIALHEHYRWPAYWSSASPFTTKAVLSSAVTLKQETHQNNAKKEALERMLVQNSNLRSAKEVIGYQIHGDDQELGQVDDMILEDESWGMAYLVLDTSSWLLKGKKTLLATPWIKWITYKEQTVQIDLTRQNIEDSPPYDPKTPINRSYEEVLYDYHGQPYLWRNK